jgi:regulator of sigma E protease
MSNLLSILYVTGAVLLLFGAAVFVHEFGHFWVARRRGMKVEAFAIGFGPKIFSWRKDGIEYSWRWIPAGGFVKLPQMITSEALEGGDTTGEPIPPASPWSKILVAFAGPLMNVIFAFVIATVIYFVGLPVALNPSIIGYVDPDSPEGKMGIQEGDTIVEVNDRPVKSWEDVYPATALARTNTIPVVIRRGGRQQTYYLATETNALFGLKTLNLDPKDHPEVVAVTGGGAAAAAGVKPKDIVVEFAGVPIAAREQLIKLIQKRPNEPSTIVVRRDGTRLALSVTPRMDPRTKYALIGVQLASAAPVYIEQRPGPDAITQVVEVLDMMGNTLSALFHHKETGVGAKDLSGPVGILSVLAVQVKTDYRLALKFLVMLNINLAILNLLPIPVLDGGHIIMSIIEWIRRKPLSVRFVEYTTTAFAVLLISFMLYVTFFDIQRFGIFREMFKRSGHVEREEPADKTAPGTPASEAPQPAPAR